MKSDNFADSLLDAIDLKQNPCVIGLDSDLARIPGILRKRFKTGPAGDFSAEGKCILEFNKSIIDHIHDLIPAVKIQAAFYEQYGPAGMQAFLDTASYAKEHGLLVIGDVKRCDIGNTSRAYSNAYLGEVKVLDSYRPSYDLNAVTVNPYLGSNGIMPFLSDCSDHGKGIFVLVKTSNKSSAELQDIQSGSGRVYEHVAKMVNEWGKGLVGKRGYSSVGAVVGAKYPDQAAKLRKEMPHAIFLVPGYGAQGGSGADIASCFKRDGYGALIHSARAVIFAYEGLGMPDEFGQAARQAAIRMKKDVLSAMKKLGRRPW